MRLMSGMIFSLLITAAALAQTSLNNGSTREDILYALDARGQGLKDFTADVSLAETDALNGETTTLVGKVWYQAKGEGDARMSASVSAKLTSARKSFSPCP